MSNEGLQKFLALYFINCFTLFLCIIYMYLYIHNISDSENIYFIYEEYIQYIKYICICININIYGICKIKTGKEKFLYSLIFYRFLYMLINNFFLYFPIFIVPPRIHHISSGGHMQVKKGNPVRIECSASGNPTPNITWTRKNNVLPNGMCTLLLCNNIYIISICRKLYNICSGLFGIFTYILYI